MTKYMRRQLAAHGATRHAPMGVFGVLKWVGLGLFASYLIARFTAGVIVPAIEYMKGLA